MDRINKKVRTKILTFLNGNNFEILRKYDLAKVYQLKRAPIRLKYLK